MPLWVSIASTWVETHKYKYIHTVHSQTKKSEMSTTGKWDTDQHRQVRFLSFFLFWFQKENVEKAKLSFQGLIAITEGNLQMSLHIALGGDYGRFSSIYLFPSISMWLYMLACINWVLFNRQPDPVDHSSCRLKIVGKVLLDDTKRPSILDFCFQQWTAGCFSCFIHKAAYLVSPISALYLYFHKT